MRCPKLLDFWHDRRVVTSMLAAAADASARLVRIHPGVEGLLRLPSTGGPTIHHIQKRISALIADEQARLFFQSLTTTREKAYTLSFRQDSHTFSPPGKSDQTTGPERLVTG